MRFSKMLGLAAVAALAAMAFVGAGSASADSACLEDVALTVECPAGKVWNGSIIGLSPETVLTAGAFEEKCKSEFLADWVKNEGSHVGVLYLILKLTFTECKGSCKEVKGNSASNLPFLVLASALKAHAVVTADGKGTPGGLLIGCTLFGFSVNCSYTAPAESLLKYLLEKDASGKPLVGSFSSAKGQGPIILSRTAEDSGLCPATGEWLADYLIYEDPASGVEGAELFLAALP